MKKKDGKEFSLTYFDGVLILIAVLLLSLGVLYGLEKKKEKDAHLSYQIGVRITVEEAFASPMPEEGDRLFDERGDALGKVVSVKWENEEDVVITCLVEEKYESGDDFVLETKEWISAGKVISVASQEEGK